MQLRNKPLGVWIAQSEPVVMDTVVFDRVNPTPSIPSVNHHWRCRDGLVELVEKYKNEK